MSGSCCLGNERDPECVPPHVAMVASDLVSTVGHDQIDTLNLSPLLTGEQGQVRSLLRYTSVFSAHDITRYSPRYPTGK